MKNSLGERIKELRIEQNLTQKKLSKILNISNTTLSQYESNTRTPNDDIKKNLAEIFKVSLDYLMGVSNIKNPYTSFDYNVDLGHDILELLISEGQISKDVVSKQVSIEEKKDILNQIKKVLDISKIIKEN